MNILLDSNVVLRTPPLTSVTILTPGGVVAPP